DRNDHVRSVRQLVAQRVRSRCEGAVPAARDPRSRIHGDRARRHAARAVGPEPHSPGRHVAASVRLDARLRGGNPAAEQHDHGHRADRLRQPRPQWRLLQGRRRRAPHYPGRRGTRVPAPMGGHRRRRGVHGDLVGDDLGVAALPSDPEARAGIQPRHPDGTAAIPVAPRRAGASGGPAHPAARRQGGAGAPVTSRLHHALLIVATALVASAHVGSPDTYFEGAAGPYPIRVIVRNPGVVPGLAEITVRLLVPRRARRVLVLPVYWDPRTAAPPPPDVAQPVPGDSALYGAALWLMRSGSYGVQVTVEGADGTGTALVPVQAVATRRLEL